MPEVTVTVSKVDDKEVRNGTIYIAHCSDGNEYNTKNASMSSTLKAVAGSGENVSLQYTVLPGNQRDDGSHWPDSRWIDKDGVTRVAGGSAPAAANSTPSTSSGGWTPEGVLRATRSNAMLAACTLLGGRQEAPTPKQLHTLADWIVDYSYGRLNPEEPPQPPEPEPAPAAAPATTPVDDDIPF